MFFSSVLAVATLLRAVGAFYLPGVAPHSYAEGDEVDLKVNKLSSIHTQLPYDYYSLKFCRPSEGVQSYSENLGEFLSGDRIENSPYKVSEQSAATSLALRFSVYSLVARALPP